MNLNNLNVQELSVEETVSVDGGIGAPVPNFSLIRALMAEPFPQ